MQLANNEDEQVFYRQFRGSFSSILRWPQLDEFWDVLRNKAGAGWFIYAPGQPLPTEAVTEQRLRQFVSEIDRLLRAEHQEDYCGIVYADNRADPTFIKIYDPNNLGVVCGFSDNPPLPGWIMSLIPPAELGEHTFTTQARKRWWQRLFG